MNRSIVGWTIAALLVIGGAAFRLVGELTVRGVTNQESFDVEVTVVDESTISGTATTTVVRSNYGLGIPNVPSVADVTDEVVLTLEFRALAG